MRRQFDIVCLIVNPNPVHTMLRNTRTYTVRYALDGIEYTADVLAFDETDARDYLVDMLAARLSALPRNADYRVLSVTAC